MKVKLLKKLRKKFRIEVRGNVYKVIGPLYDSACGYFRGEREIYVTYELENAVWRRNAMISEYLRDNYWRPKDII